VAEAKQVEHRVSAVAVALGSGVSLSPAGLMPSSPSEDAVTLTPFATGLAAYQPASAPMQPVMSVQTGSEALVVIQGPDRENGRAFAAWPASTTTYHQVPVDPAAVLGEPMPSEPTSREPQQLRGLERTDPDNAVPPHPARLRIEPAVDTDLEELASELVRVGIWNAAETLNAPAQPRDGARKASWAVNVLLRDGTVGESESRPRSGSFPPELAAILLVRVSAATGRAWPPPGIEKRTARIPFSPAAPSEAAKPVLAVIGGSAREARP
jgi:hypothetical protein